MTATRRPTLATIAEALGVSRMTVSNAFNRPDQLSPELRERVLATAQELGYAGPNPVARTLSRGRTGSIGVVLDAPLTLAFSDPAAVQLLHGVATVCEERELGMSLVPRIPGHDAALVRTALVDGFVVYCMGDDDPRLDAIVERRLPYTLIDHAPDVRRPHGQHRRSWRRPRHRRASDRARPPPLRDRARLGQSAPGARRAALPRRSRAAVRLARRARGREASPGTTSRSPARPTSTSRPAAIAGGHLLDRADRPTAIICTSDVLALGVLQAAADRGVPVPQALSVTGFDDAPDAVARRSHHRPPAARREGRGGPAPPARRHGQGVRAPPHRTRSPFLDRPLSLNALHRKHPHGCPARVRPRSPARASATP